MEPVTLVVVSGFLGGLVFAFIIRHWQQPSSLPDLSRPRTLPTDVINMARIRVSGVGGLGMVAMSAVIALAIPRIGQTLAVGLVLGVVLAVILIVRRGQAGSADRGDGPLPDAAVLGLRDRSRTARPRDTSAPRLRLSRAAAGRA